MVPSLRSLLANIEPESDFIVHAPDALGACSPCSYRLVWAVRLHHEMVFRLPDGGFHQADLAFVTHPVTGEVHAFIIASHEDHEGCWQEIISCDELLECRGWDDFLDCLYSYSLDSGLELTVTNRDAFLHVMPAWMDALA